MKKRIEELEATAKKILAELEEIKKEQSKTLLSAMKPGEEFQIEGKTFVVLDNTDTGTYVISKGFWGGKIKFGDNRNYKESFLKNVLEEKFLPWLESAIGAENIVENEVDLRSVDGKNEFGSFKSKVRPLTFEEYRKYTDYIENKDLPDWWWTCTPWSTEERGWKYSVAVVSPSGNIFSFNFGGSNGVRPFCILKSEIFVSVEE